MTGRAGCHRRSFIIIAVLVIVGSALLVATSLLFLMQAEASASSNHAAAAQARALIWSGVQVVMQRLDEQRDVILEGDVPRLEEEYLVYETETRLGLVRLLPVGPGDDVLVPEAGRLDLQEVTADDLVATGLVEADLARAIVAHRDGRRGGLQSVAGLLQVPGMTPSALYGPIELIRVVEDAMPGDLPIDDGAGADGVGDRLPRGLADVVTVYAVEPPLQASGELRINLNTEWSEELGDRVADRFGEDARQTLRRLFQSGASFTSDTDICRTLRTLGVPLESWPEILDTFTTTSGEFIFGRLDINEAPYETLLALPGIEPEQASQIVRVREDLDADERSTIAWPALQGILEPETYDELADRITTRSWVYRVRLAAGEVVAEASDGPLMNPLVCEAVIDLSAPRPRLAYLRDITLLETTARVAAASGPAEDAAEPFAADDEAGLDLPVAMPGAGTGEDETWDDESWADESWADDAWDEETGADPDDEGIGAEAGDFPSAAGGRGAAPPDPAGGASAGDDGGGSSRGRVGRWRGG